MWRSWAASRAESAVPDVALGYDSPADYAAGRTYFGAVVGRCANRIACGQFTLDGSPYQLAVNNPPNALHGGPTGFHSRWWTVDALLDADGAPLAAGAVTPPAGVTLSYTSAAGEEGYPGALTARVTYLLGAAAAPGESDPLPALRCAFAATCEAPTLVNLAQHCYWNLGGHAAGSVLGSHTLRMPLAERYTPVDSTLIPTGELLPTQGSPYDFAQATLLGARAGAVPGGRGYDTNLVLSGPNAMRAAAQAPGPLALAAEVSHGASGRGMRLWTDAPGCQLYVGGFLEAEAGKDGAVYRQYGGLALETQLFPDGINHAEFPSPVLRPGQTYTHNMLTQFTAAGSG